jgi:hypothetical protein
VYYKAGNINVTKIDLSGVMTALRDGAITEGIFITSISFENDVYEIARNANIVLWDREKLINEIGKAVLGEGGEDITKPEELRTPVQQLAATTEELIAPPGMPAVATAPVPQAPRHQISIPDGATSLIIRPKAKKEDVMAIAGVKVHTIGTSKLVLVPYYIFDFSCKLKVEGLREPREVYGTIRLNAITKDEGEWHRDFQVTTNIKMENEKLEPRYDTEEAFKTARLAVIAINTRSIEVESKRGFTTLFESRKARPIEDTIEINEMKLYHIPIWIVEGSNGKIEIDSTDGKILREDLYEVEEI